MKIITKINKKDKSSAEIKTNIISIFKFLNIFVLEKELDLIFNKQTYKRPIITAFDKLNDINIFISKIELTEDDSFIYIHFNSLHHKTLFNDDKIASFKNILSIIKQVHYNFSLNLVHIHKHHNKENEIHFIKKYYEENVLLMKELIESSFLKLN